MVTQEFLKQRYYYEDGHLFYKHNHKRVGSVNGRGYLLCGIGGKSYRVHRLIFLLHHGYLPSLIDHIDRNKLNNHIENLREATISDNNHNRENSSNTGYKGIHYSNSRGKYKAAITHNKVYHYIGFFKTLSEAIEAYKIKSIELFGKYEKL
jgi:hypothetical protein